jgi:hypothetical protein
MSDGVIVEEKKKERMEQPAEVQVAEIQQHMENGINQMQDMYAGLAAIRTLRYLLDSAIEVARA